MQFSLELYKGWWGQLARRIP